MYGNKNWIANCCTSHYINKEPWTTNYLTRTHKPMLDVPEISTDGEMRFIDYNNVGKWPIIMS